MEQKPLKNQEKTRFFWQLIPVRTKSPFLGPKIIFKNVKTQVVPGTKYGFFH